MFHLRSAPLICRDSKSKPICRAIELTTGEEFRGLPADIAGAEITARRFGALVHAHSQRQSSDQWRRCLRRCGLNFMGAASCRRNCEIEHKPNSPALPPEPERETRFLAHDIDLSHDGHRRVVDASRNCINRSPMSPPRRLPAMAAGVLRAAGCGAYRPKPISAMRFLESIKEFLN